MMEWIRFAVSAILFLMGMIFIAVSVVGVFRFRFALNRMHSASIIDTLGVLFMTAAVFVSTDLSAASVKLVLIVAFIWVGSPIASHLVSLLELDTDDELANHMTYHDKTKEAK